MPKSLNAIDMNKNEIYNLVLQTLGTDPPAPTTGQMWYNSTLNEGRYFDGTSVQSFGGAVKSATVNGTSVAVITLYAPTGAGASGQVLQSAGSGNAPEWVSSLPASIIGSGVLSVPRGGTGVATIAGIVKANGTDAMSAATAGDIVSAIGTTAVANAANATKATEDSDGNVIGSTYAKLASPVLTGTPTAPTAAAGTNTTQLATTGFVTTAISGAVLGTSHYKGSLTSTADVTSLTSYKTGDWWRVTAAFSVTGMTPIADFQVGDLIQCIADYGSAFQTADFTGIEGNRNGVEGPDTSTDGHLAVMSGTTGKVIADSGIASAGLMHKVVADMVGDGTTKDFVITHNLGTTDVIVSVRDVTTKQDVIADIEHTGANTVTVKCSVAPASGTDYRVVIGG